MLKKESFFKDTPTHTQIKQQQQQKTNKLLENVIYIVREPFLIQLIYFTFM